MAAESSTKRTSKKKSRWDARLPRPSNLKLLSHGQLGRSKLQVEYGTLKRQRRGTGYFAHLLGKYENNCRPSNGFKIVAVFTAKMDELRRLIAYSDKQNLLDNPTSFCGYRELIDDDTLGRAILWQAVRKQSWLRLVTEKWYPLLNRLHFNCRNSDKDSMKPESEHQYIKYPDGTLSETADKILFANVGSHGHDDRIYILDPSIYKNARLVSSKMSVGKNIRDSDVWTLNDTRIDHWLEQLRKSKQSQDFDHARMLCGRRQALLPMDQKRNQFYLTLRMNPERYKI